MAVSDKHHQARIDEIVSYSRRVKNHAISTQLGISKEIFKLNYRKPCAR